MANRSISPSSQPNQGGDEGSDYGSEFTPEEEELLNELLSKVSTGQPSEPRVEETSNSVQTGHALGWKLQTGSYKPRLEVEIEASVEDGPGDSGTRKAQRNETRTQEHPIAIKSNVGLEINAKSPLERFRTPPRKALSVTDLVSPAWCELQYLNMLDVYGRVRRTAVMKRGTAVHKTLEEQVHKTVPVDVTTTEDAWGLRLWNVIQGLRTLRKTGMTRELEIWGAVDGLLVNGVIDEISFTCPDEELEAEDLSNMELIRDTPADQSLVADFITPSSVHSEDRILGRSRLPSKKVYLIDVKTRKTRSLPNGASFRPTLFQLMLYHRFFSDLVSNCFDADILFRRYQVDPSANFSDSFITQIAALDGCSYNGSATGLEIEEPEPRGGQDLLDLLLENNSVKGLWALMMREFHRTVPAGAEGIGAVLKAEYRSQTDGSVFGHKTFLHNDEILEKYLEDEIMWWRGKREARGVSIEEAYKCQSCEFAGDCKWRIAKIEESMQKKSRREEISYAKSARWIF